MSQTGTNSLKGKTYEQIYGVEKALQLKSCRGLCSKGKTFEQLYGPKKAKRLKKQHGLAIKGKYTGKKSVWYGKHHSKSTKKKISLSLQGRLIGEKNPMYGKHHSKATKRKLRLVRTGRLMGKDNYMYGRTHTKQVREQISLSKKGKEFPNLQGVHNGNWQGGKSQEKYGAAFNTRLKKQIRERDNFTCQECGFTQDQLGRQLCIHHIDYNKSNHAPSNLISLCLSCHMQTNYERKDWTSYFQSKLTVPNY